MFVGLYGYFSEDGRVVNHIVEVNKVIVPKLLFALVNGLGNVGNHKRPDTCLWVDVGEVKLFYESFKAGRVKPTEGKLVVLDKGS